MHELEYPFDAEYILKKKKSIKRKLLEERNDFTDKKIAILGGSTTANIRLCLELFLLNQGIRPSFYESEYNMFYEDAMFGNEELDNFHPDIIYICTSNHNIQNYPTVGMSDNAETTHNVSDKKMESADGAMDKVTAEDLLNVEFSRYETMWETLRQKFNCPIIQNNFEMPYFRLMGNRDAWDPSGRVHFLRKMNERFAEYAASHEGFYICDIEYISADYGLKAWSDPFYWHMYKYAVAVPAIPYLSFNVSNIIKSIFGKNKKGLVLDLDNTLWGGVIGDDGVEGIKIGPEESEGQAYWEFQNYLKEQTKLGVLLAVDSKNDEDKALGGLKSSDNVLHPDDFAVIKANWEPKGQNFSEIANTLNLLPESLVFVDDNPAERANVEGFLPGVTAPEMGEAYQYIERLDRGGYFETTLFTADDAKRTEMYKENAKRSAEMSRFTDYSDYLKSLEMKAEIGPFVPLYMSRIAQLTNKSNQFNLTTKRYTEDEIRLAADDPSRITLYGKLADKFGDNGVVSVIIGQIKGDECLIELWLMSCRVLKRGMENAMLDALLTECKKRRIKTVRGIYIPTAKNGMVKDFYGTMGFTFEEESEDGTTTWILQVDGEQEFEPYYIDIV